MTDNEIERLRAALSSDGRTDEAKAREVEAASGSFGHGESRGIALNHGSPDQAGVGSERSSPSEALLEVNNLLSRDELVRYFRTEEYADEIADIISNFPPAEHVTAPPPEHVVANKRPVAFRVPRLFGDMVSHYFVTTSEDEARAMADTNQVEYEGLYLVSDRGSGDVPPLSSTPPASRTEGRDLDHLTVSGSPAPEIVTPAPSMPRRDYLAMSDYDAYTACGADARNWADWFCQVAATHGLKIEPDWMETWFANAMMARVDFDQRAECAALSASKGEGNG